MKKGMQETDLTGVSCTQLTCVYADYVTRIVDIVRMPAVAVAELLLFTRSCSTLPGVGSLHIREISSGSFIWR